MTFNYTLTDLEETAINSLVAKANKDKPIAEQVTAQQLIRKFIKGYLRVHSDKLRLGTRRKVFTAYSNLAAADKATVDAILGLL